MKGKLSIFGTEVTTCAVYWWLYKSFETRLITMVISMVIILPSNYNSIKIDIEIKLSHFLITYYLVTRTVSCLVFEFFILTMAPSPIRDTFMRRSDAVGGAVTYEVGK